MGKFMKRCLVILLVFAAVGAVLGIAGSTVAGRETISQVVETVTGGRVRMELGDWSRWGFTVGDDFFGSAFGDSGEDELYDIEDAMAFDKGHEVMKGNVEKYCPGGDIRILDVEVGGCTFETRYSEDGNIYLEAENAYKFQGYVVDGTLYVRATNGSLNNWSEISKFRITLYLPEGYGFDVADVSMGAGVMTLAGLEAADLSMDAGAGEISVSGIHADELKASIGAGAISLEDMDVTCLDVTVGMGRFAADGIVRGDADIECSMGNVELMLDGGKEDFNYELQGSMGNIDLEGESVSGFSQERTIDNGADKDMEVNCSMGNITIMFKG